jgi:hypothetical protein
VDLQADDQETLMIIRTFGVLAGAYVRRDDARSCLTHAAEVDGDGLPVRVLCAGVKVENLCPDGYTPEQLAAPPTCPRCAKRLRGFTR